MKSIASTVLAALAALALGVLAGCAASGGASNTAGAGSGVTVFGTVDAGVSQVTNKSGR